MMRGSQRTYNAAKYRKLVECVGEASSNRNIKIEDKKTTSSIKSGVLSCQILLLLLLFILFISKITITNKHFYPILRTISHRQMISIQFAVI